MLDNQKLKKYTLLDNNEIVIETDNDDEIVRQIGIIIESMNYTWWSGPGEQPISDVIDCMRIMCYELEEKDPIKLFDHLLKYDDCYELIIHL